MIQKVQTIPPIKKGDYIARQEEGGFSKSKVHTYLWTGILIDKRRIQTYSFVRCLYVRNDKGKAQSL